MASAGRLVTKMMEDWGDGPARLWSPTFDMVRPVLEKMKDDGVQGVLITIHGLRAALVRMVEQISDAHSLVGAGAYNSMIRRSDLSQPRVGARDRSYQAIEPWSSSILDAVVTRTGASATGVASMAVDLLSQHCWADWTWVTRRKQWRKRVYFCKQDEHSAFPASEGDDLALVGFLKLRGKISAASLP
jgi:hypothetical protein